MDAHYLQACRLGVFNKLMWENRRDIDWKNQWKRILWAYTSACVMEVPGLAERALYKKKIEATKIEKPPLFILGHWRSGTTFLFNLLSCDPDTVFMNSVETFTSNQYLTIPKLLDKVYDHELDGSRPGDTMDFLAESPQEECYAVCSMTEATHTHLIGFPQAALKYINLNFPGGMSPQEQQEWKKAHLYLVKKLTMAKGNKRILLKSPDNTAKLQLLQQIYPEAKYINIYRDPYKVIMSALNMYKEGIAMETFEKMPSDEEIEDLTIEMFRRLYVQYFRDMQSVPKDQLIEIGYSELTKDPLATLERIYTQLNLPGFEEAKPFFMEHIESQKHYKTNKFTLEPGLQKKINDRLGFYFEHYGFEMKPVEE